MNIQFNTFSLGNNVAIPSFSNDKFRATNPAMASTLSNDVFVKSADPVNFKGKGDGPDKDDILALLTLIGFVGAPFVLAIVAGSAEDSEYAKHIFLPDGTYLMSTDDFKVETDTVVADADDGVLKIKGTPIDIDASKYDYADVEKGVFKNYDGSVDIDLMHNKYIDVENGVFIDPEAKLTAVRGADGLIHNIVVPDVMSPAFHGSPMSGGYVSPRRLTRSEFIEKHGQTPEDYDAADPIRGIRPVVPDDNRTVLRKLLDAIDFRQLIGGYKYDHSKDYDIYGREIIDIVKPDGSRSRVALDENLREFMKDHHLKDKSLGEIADFFEKLKTEKYLITNYPAPEVKAAPVESMQEFMEGLAHNNADVATEAISGSIAETVAENPDAHHTVWESIKEWFNSVIEG